MGIQSCVDTGENDLAYERLGSDSSIFVADCNVLFTCLLMRLLLVVLLVSSLGISML